MEAKHIADPWFNFQRIPILLNVEQSYDTVRQAFNVGSNHFPVLFKHFSTLKKIWWAG